MKSLLLYFILLLFVLALGCKNEEKLTFEPFSLENEACVECPEIAIDIPKALEQTKIAQAINTAISEEIIALLIFEEETEISELKDAIISFNKGYFDLQALYDDEATDWQARIKGEVTYEDAEILTVALDAYLFTGGAHGYTTKRFLNFDKKKGVELENWQLFKNEEDFRMYAETVFREKEHIPQDKPINHTGFMFEQDTFYLPENIGFTKDGLKLRYNQYEVAPYSDGPIEIVLSQDQVKSYLSIKSKP